MWTRVEPLIIDYSEIVILHNFTKKETLKNMFSGNKAEIYGNDIASPPSMIKLLK